MKQIITGALIGLIGICGCSMFKQVDANQWAKDYYGQAKTSPMIQIAWKGAGKVTIEATDLSFVVSAPVPPLSVIPRDPGFYEALAQCLPMAGMVFMGLEAIKQKPTIIQQPEPLVLEPTVITK